jgi:hypothetical protein
MLSICTPIINFIHIAWGRGKVVFSLSLVCLYFCSPSILFLNEMQMNEWIAVVHCHRCLCLSLLLSIPNRLHSIPSNITFRYALCCAVCVYNQIIIIAIVGPLSLHCCMIIDWMQKPHTCNNETELMNWDWNVRARDGKTCDLSLHLLMCWWFKMTKKMVMRKDVKLWQKNI